MNVLVQAIPVFDLPATLNSLQPVAIHLFIVGWLTQLIFGVAYWMFPKMSKENPRGDSGLGWTTYVLLNAGLVARVIGEPAIAIAPELGLTWLLPISAICQLIAAWAFIFNMWGRVKER